MSDGLCVKCIVVNKFYWKKSLMIYIELFSSGSGANTIKFGDP
jgi:hypothetical protein